MAFFLQPCWVIQALRHLGPDHIDAGTVEQLKRTLNEHEKAALLREAINAPGWLFPTLQKIGQSKALK